MTYASTQVISSGILQTQSTWAVAQCLASSRCPMYTLPCAGETAMLEAGWYCYMRCIIFNLWPLRYIKTKNWYMYLLVTGPVIFLLYGVLLNHISGKIHFVQCGIQYSSWWLILRCICEWVVKLSWLIGLSMKDDSVELKLQKKKLITEDSITHLSKL